MNEQIITKPFNLVDVDEILRVLDACSDIGEGHGGIVISADWIATENNIPANSTKAVSPDDDGGVVLILADTRDLLTAWSLLSLRRQWRDVPVIPSLASHRDPLASDAPVHGECVGNIQWAGE